MNEHETDLGNQRARVRDCGVRLARLITTINQRETVGITVQKDNADVYVLQITGMLTKKEFDELQDKAAKNLGFFGRAKLLVIAEEFGGWEPGADWDVSSFSSWHGWQITKIAIVADPQWKSKFLAFTMAGMRRAPVEFFPTGQAEEARAWLEATQPEQIR